MPGVFVDRIEEESATLVENGEERRVPLIDLPNGIQEGDWLSADLTRIDVGARAEAERQIDERRKRLLEGDDGGDLGL